MTSNVRLIEALGGGREHCEEIAVHQPGSRETGTELIKASDMALYEAKRSGRDCVRSSPELKPAGPAKSVAG